MDITARNLFAHNGHIVAAIGEHGRYSQPPLSNIPFSTLPPHGTRAFLFAGDGAARYHDAGNDQRTKLVCGSTSPRRCAQRALEPFLFKCGFISSEQRRSAVGTHLTGTEIRHRWRYRRRDRDPHRRNVSGDLPQLRGHFFPGGSCRLASLFLLTPPVNDTLAMPIDRSDARLHPRPATLIHRRQAASLSPNFGQPPSAVNG